MFCFLYFDYIHLFHICVPGNKVQELFKNYQISWLQRFLVQSSCHILKTCWKTVKNVFSALRLVRCMEKVGYNLLSNNGSSYFFPYQWSALPRMLKQNRGKKGDRKVGKAAESSKRSLKIRNFKWNLFKSLLQRKVWELEGWKTV